jgi:hypothetical protein
VGDDLADKAKWTGSIGDACEEATGERDCLRITYDVYEVDARGRTRIPDPGPNYYRADPTVYDNCDVTEITPPTDDGTLVPAGSAVTIEIECTPVEPEVTQTPDEGAATTDGTTSTPDGPQG